ncbi:YczE/YyaS/YitT family protein [Butyrivibrio sp. MB2005]|uniref:YczE/YyaS/YitT family protein n=1 Tax=Butyrivibrio sp. MB2005 TaxID=1280678 RepID=UPI0003F7E3C3|nr:membrane protein [Butyrivibrio sp. MB2005]
MKDKNLAKRTCMTLFGVIICAISVGIFKIAALGVDPFQSFMAGLDLVVPISFGTLYVITNAVLLTFALIFDRHYIGIATFINLFLLGYITQFTYEFLQTVIVNPSIIVRVFCLVVGVVIICFGSAFYMTADLGVSTYDAIALIICNTWKKGKFQYVRIITDLVCVILGVVLFLISGGKVMSIPTIAGIGTIITAFFMGPLIEFFNVHVARPILAGKEIQK